MKKPQTEIHTNSLRLRDQSLSERPVWPGYIGVLCDRSVQSECYSPFNDIVNHQCMLYVIYRPMGGNGHESHFGGSSTPGTEGQRRLPPCDCA